MIPVLTQVSLQVRGAGLSSDCQKVFLVVCFVCNSVMSVESTYIFEVRNACFPWHTREQLVRKVISDRIGYIQSELPQ